MKRVLKITAIVVLLVLLILVRAFEVSLFYDPLIAFFKYDYKTLPLPDLNIFALQVGVALRFLLNTLISLAILWIVFRDREIIKIATILYSLLFVAFFIAFSFIVFSSKGTDSHFILFYVRRFLIQPLFLLILLPAFYFQKYKNK
jgi:exosortase F-associated protein